MNRFELAACLSLVSVSALGAGLTGCTPHIGAKCNVNTDCSLQGTLVCDTSQPDGYCTLFNCVADSCQNEAACVMLNASVPGCPYDDYAAPARTGRTMCLEQCHKDSDCRTSDGYVCADPRQPPWNGVIVDDDQSQHVCLVAPDDYDGGPAASFPDAAVCQSKGPSVPSIEASVSAGDAENDAGAEAAAQAATDSGPDVGADVAADAPTDGGADADATAEGGADATTDGGADVGADAEEGGE
jgi:hypothetical protein